MSEQGGAQKFVHLRLHTAYSLLEGAIKLNCNELFKQKYTYDLNKH